MVTQRGLGTARGRRVGSGSAEGCRRALEAHRRRRSARVGRPGRREGHAALVPRGLHGQNPSERRGHISAMSFASKVGAL